MWFGFTSITFALSIIPSTNVNGVSRRHLAYFLSSAGGVRPAARPLSPAKLAFDPSSSLRKEVSNPSSNRRRKLNALDAEKRVVLRYTLRTRRGTSLDLTGSERDDKVGDDSVLRLAGAVRNHHTPAVGLGELCPTRLNVNFSLSRHESLGTRTP
jgi:hypothetical protein